MIGAFFFSDQFARNSIRWIRGWLRALLTGVQLPEQNEAATRARMGRRFPLCSEALAPPQLQEAIRAVLATDGRAGGFSAHDGATTKLRLLLIERAGSTGRVCLMTRWMRGCPKLIDGKFSLFIQELLTHSARGLEVKNI